MTFTIALTSGYMTFILGALGLILLILLIGGGD